MIGHRDYGWTYAPHPDVLTPQGNRNTGYVTSIVPGYQGFHRADVPAEMTNEFGFGLSRPRMMREPGAMWGTYTAKA